MTSTELVPDRLAPTPGMVGDHTVAYVDYDNAADGIWCAGGYTWCGEHSPRDAHDNTYRCSRPQGHPAHWAHVACAGRILAVWGGGVSADPMAAVGVDTRSNHPDYTHPVHGVYVDSDHWCRVRYPDGLGLCSRRAGHPAHWAHVAANATRVISVWHGAAAPDPFAHVTAHSGHASDFPSWDDPDTGIRVPGVANWCQESHENFNSVCTRARGHYGQHIGTSSTGRIRWVKPNDRVPPVVEPVDPEDGSAADDESLVFTEAPEVGAVVKLRDRTNRLYVIAVRQGSSEVEVLDLQRQELRAVPFGRCVKIDSMLSVEELGWVAKWYSSHRDNVRKVAVREYKGGRWCMDGLNQNLRSLGLERYEPTLTGNITVRLPFECPDVHATQSTIESRVREALAKPTVSAALRLSLPLVDGIELKSDELSVSATEFTRK